jgi:hypothetical protein
MDETFYLEAYYPTTYDTWFDNFFKDKYRRKKIIVIVTDPCPAGTVTV